MNNAFKAWWMPSKTAVSSLYKNCRLFCCEGQRTMMAAAVPHTQMETVL